MMAGQSSNNGALPYAPVIIIGAGRSGTNILRDTLTRLPGAGTWPCDEINTIWRQGNIRFPTDEFSPEMVTPANEKKIRQAFDRLAGQQALTHVIEKTCANSLRVIFVNRIVPEAKYIFIVRDGRDVAASAMKRWAASLDLPYLLRKARYVPLMDTPYYGCRYLWNQLYRLVSGKKRLAFWGPRFNGMDQAVRIYPLAGICALQWKRCVDKAEEDLLTIDSNRVYRLSYETFVRRPEEELLLLARFLDIAIDQNLALHVTEDIFASSIGRWKSDLTAREQALVDSIVRTTNARYGYC